MRFHFYWTQVKVWISGQDQCNTKYLPDKGKHMENMQIIPKIVILIRFT